MIKSISRIRSKKGWSCVAALLIVLFSAAAFGSTYTIQIGAPNGANDTLVLQGALDECVNYHPAGCEIRLSAGTYMSGPLTATNFHGSIVGKGIDATVIDAIPQHPDASSLLVFTDSDIAVSDLTLRVTVQAAGDCQGFCVFALLGVVGNTGSVSARRVAFEGEPGPDTGFGAYNLYGGLLVQGNPEIKSNVEVTGCRFKNMSEAIRVWGVADSRVSIGGSAADANTFDSHVIGIYMPETDHSVVDISQNTIVNSDAGMMIVQNGEWDHQPANFTIRQNHMTVSGYSSVFNWNTGIVVVDLLPANYGEPASSFELSNNDIKLANCPACDGIEVNVTEGAVVTGNKLSGTAVDGIWVWASDGCILKANNLLTLSASWADILLDTDYLDTPIVPTMNCTVVGGNPKSTVWMDSESTDNTLVGVNNMHGNPPGPSVRNAMLKKAQIGKETMALRR